MRSPAPGYENQMIMILCGYAVLKGVYHFTFTYLWHQGHWYFPLSIMIFNLLLARAISSAVSKNFSTKQKIVSAVAGVIWVVLIANAFAVFILGGEEEQRCFEFWNSRRTLIEGLEPECKSGGIVAFEDGVISYSLKVPVMSGFGFNLDREAYLARDRGELLDIAYKRGYRYLASLNYLDIPELAEADESVLHGYISSRYFLHGQKLSRWSFSMAAHDPETWTLIRFEPRK